MVSCKSSLKPIQSESSLPQNQPGLRVFWPAHPRADKCDDGVTNRRDVRTPFSTKASTSRGIQKRQVVVNPGSLICIYIIYIYIYVYKVYLLNALRFYCTVKAQNTSDKLLFLWLFQWGYSVCIYLTIKCI